MKTLLLSKQLLSLVLISFVHIFAQGHFSGGSGTESDPFVITSPQQLSNIRYYTGPEHKQKHFLLQNNIDLGTAPWNQGSGWEPIGSKDTLNPPFEGAFDGNGKSISNLYISSDTGFVGLFGYSTGEIKNLHLVSVDVSGKNCTGGMCGRHDSGSVISCTVSGTVKGNNYVGGLIGETRNSELISNCSVSVSVEGLGWVGAMAGMNVRGKITGCSSSGEVTGSSFSGGLIGNSHYGIIESCFSTVNVTGGEKTGGFIGEDLHCRIDSCYASGTVSCTEEGCGGFAGGHYQYGVIEDCYATGMVQGKNSAGGFAGISADTLRRCYSTGKVSGSDLVGGLVGLAYGSIFSSFATGKVDGIVTVGGLAGETYDRVMNSYACGEVIAAEDKAAGFIGRNCAADVQMCYSTGKVKTPGPLYSGFVINDCGKKKFPNCYYDSATADCSDTAAAMPLTSLQMATRSSFSDWKFDSIWVIDEGRTYPYLKWQNEPSEHNIIPGVSALRNVSSGMIMRPSDDGVRFQGNSVITCNGFCKIRLFSSNGSLVSTFTSEKPSVYEPFKNGNVNKGIYIATVFRPGKQAFSRVLINR